jgi:hypothetical protein
MAAFQLDRNDYLCGTTKVFFRANKAEYMERIQKCGTCTRTRTRARSASAAATHVKPCDAQGGADAGDHRVHPAIRAPQAARARAVSTGDAVAAPWQPSAVHRGLRQCRAKLLSVRRRLAAIR